MSRDSWIFGPRKPIFDSSRSDKKEVAKRLLQAREVGTAKGEIPGIDFDRVRFSFHSA